MPAKAKLTDEQVKKTRRRVRAGERLTDIAAEYGVNRKTIRRRLDAAELADAERARRTAAKRAEQKRARRRPENAIPIALGNRPELFRQPSALAPPAGGSTGRRSRQEGGRILNISGGILGSSNAAYMAWLDEHDARVPLTRADLQSESYHAAARAVAAGGGMQAVIEATGLRTLKNVLSLIDPAILDRARQNDAARPPAAAPPT